MPLAGQISTVVSLFQYFGDGYALFRQVPTITVDVIVEMRHVTHSNLMWIHTGQEAGSCWTATCCIVKLGISQTLRCEAIQVGCIDFAAVASDVRVTHVVSQNENNIGLFHRDLERPIGTRSSPAKDPGGTKVSDLKRENIMNLRVLCDYFQLSGMTFEAIMETIKPTTAIIVAMTEKLVSVSPSVMPLILLITQNPLSFIQGTGLEPNPITMAR